jgi:hypothetical protein
MQFNSQSFPVFILIFFVALLHSSCGEIDRGGMQPSTGGTNEIMIVTNSEAMWKGKIGQTIQAYFGAELPGLPQPENKFSMAHIPEDNLSKMLKIHHNVFIVDVNSEYSEPILETRKDLWSSPQRVVKITVPDEQSFFEEFDKNKEAFIELFNENERRRVNEAYGAIEDFNITNMLEEDFDLEILIPKSFTIGKKEDDFIWLRREAERFSQGILIYTYPYTDTIAFNYDRILQVRDSITKKHIPGPSDGSYMKIGMIEPPVMNRLEFNNMFAVEMRGLWELEGDFMGGPFVSYTVVDERHNRVVTVDGFVYNPGREKRDLVRQVESLLYTLSFPGESDDVAAKE